MSIEFSFNIKRKPPKAGPKNGTANEKDIYLKGDNGSTVILIHGFTGTPYEMGYLAKFLNRKGYSVTCPMLANHGEPLDVLKKVTWQKCYETIREEFKRVKARNSNEKIFVSGLSIGALLALLIADEFKENVSGVSCLSPTIFYDGWNMPWVRHLLPLAYFTPLKYFSYFKEEPPYGIKNKAIQNRVHRFYRNATLENNVEDIIQYGYPYIPVTLMYQHRLLLRFFKKILPRITVPLLLIQAKEDDMTSVRNSRYIYKRIGSKTKEIIFLDNSYHVITVDQQRDIVAQGIDEFFEKIKRGARQEAQASGRP